jgi:hypothetical protein
VSSTGAVQQSWSGGTAPAGYVIYRLDMVTGALTTRTVSTLETSATDSSFTAAGGIYCYLLVNPGAGKQSDIICGFRSTRTGTGAPENLFLRVSGGNANLTWSPPSGGGQSGYNVRVLAGSATPPPTLGPTAIGASIPLSGLACFQVEAIGRGSSDVVCAIPGVSNF